MQLTKDSKRKLPKKPVAPVNITVFVLLNIYYKKSAKEPLTWTPPVLLNEIDNGGHCSLTSGLLMKISLLASMEFADGALSEKRGMHPQEVPRV